MIEVVAGIILRGDRILLQQRPMTRDFALTWECPGGKVEPIVDQDKRGALGRELREEIGWPIDAHVNHIKPSSFYMARFSKGERAANVTIKDDFAISFFNVVPPEAWQPSMRDNQAGLGWFTLTEMAVLKLTPGNVGLLRHIQDVGLDFLKKVTVTP